MLDYKCCYCYIPLNSEVLLLIQSSSKVGAWYTSDGDLILASFILITLFL